jgi:outer membrane protein assembly factor BamB
MGPFRRTKPSTPTFNHAEDTIYLIGDCSRVYALDLATGAQLWNYSIWSSQGNCGMYDATVGPDGTIYFGWGAAQLYAIWPNGTLKFKSVIPADDPFNAGPLVSYLDNTIYTGGIEDIYAFAPNGIVLWRYEHPDPSPQKAFSHSPTIDNRGVLYYPVADTVSALEAKSGKLLWAYKMETKYYASGIVGCNCPPPFSQSRCAIACQLQ